MKKCRGEGRGHVLRPSYVKAVDWEFTVLVISRHHHNNSMQWTLLDLISRRKSSKIRVSGIFCFISAYNLLTISCLSQIWFQNPWVLEERHHIILSLVISLSSFSCPLPPAPWPLCCLMHCVQPALSLGIQHSAFFPSAFPCSLSPFQSLFFLLLNFPCVSLILKVLLGKVNTLGL